MAALLKLLQPGDPIFDGRYTVGEVLGGDKSRLLARLSDHDLLLRDYPAPDLSDEQQRELCQRRTNLDHPNLLPVAESCFEDGRFRVLQPDLGASTLESFARWSEDQVPTETWLKLALQLARLLSFLKEHCDGTVLELKLSDLLLVDGHLYLAERGWSGIEAAKTCPPSAVEQHYVEQFSLITGKLLQTLEARGRSTTSLAWLLQRRYGSLKEVLQDLRAEIDSKHREAFEVSPLEDFEIPELAPLPSASELFFQQRPSHLLAEFALVGVLLLVGVYFLLRPPPTVPSSPVYLHTPGRTLVYDTTQEKIGPAWRSRDTKDFIARRSPAILVSIIPGSSQLVELDGATGNERNRVLLPTPVSPTRLLATETGFVAIAPGRAIVGSVDPEVGALRVVRALPAGRSCRAAKAYGEDFYLADETMLRRYQLNSGSILAERRLPGVTELVLLPEGLAVLQQAAKQITLLDPETLKLKKTISTESHEPLDLFPVGPGRSLILTAGGDLGEFDLGSGSVSLVQGAPTSIRSAALAYGELWLLTENGQVSILDPQTLESTTLVLNPRITALTIPR